VAAGQAHTQGLEGSWPGGVSKAGDEHGGEGERWHAQRGTHGGIARGAAPAPCRHSFASACSPGRVVRSQAKQLTVERRTMGTLGARGVARVDAALTGAAAG
jgi:hypothetical protein